jgi:PRC-barrel domain
MRESGKLPIRGLVDAMSIKIRPPRRENGAENESNRARPQHSDPRGGEPERADRRHDRGSGHGNPGDARLGSVHLPCPVRLGPTGAAACAGAARRHGETSPSAGTPSGQTAQPGVRAIDPATLRMTFYTVQPADMLASNLMGLDVHNLKNEEIGEIEDLIIDNGKMLRGIVVGIGGFLGIGERRTVIEPASIVLTREANGSLKAVVNTTREDLKKAPEFKFEGAMARNKSK